MKTPMEQRIKQMANSKELKANLRRDDNALELAALYVRALYLLNMSKRNVDCDQRHNFGATKELLLSVMGENVIDDYEYGFYDQDMFSPECTAKDIDDFYSDTIKRKEENEEDQHYNDMAQNVMEWEELDAWRDAMNYDEEYYDPSDATQFQNEYLAKLKVEGYFCGVKFSIRSTHKGSNIHKVWLYVGDNKIHNFTGDKGECLEFVKELIDAK